MKNLRTISVLFLCMILGQSCQDTLWDDNTSVKDGTLVDVCLNVSVTPSTSMTGEEVDKTETRTSSAEMATSYEGSDIVCEAVVPDATISRLTRASGDYGIVDNEDITDIDNLLVVQFDGTDNNAKFVKQVYIENYNYQDGGGNYPNRTIQLVASKSEQTIVCIANTFDKSLSFANQTLSECKAMVYPAVTLDRVVSRNPNEYDTSDSADPFPGNAKYYQRMNGAAVTAIEDGGDISCNLYHNVCKIDLEIVNNAGTVSASNPYSVTLHAADILNVPKGIYYYNSYRDKTSVTAGYPTQTNMNLYGIYDIPNVITWDNTTEPKEGLSATAKTARLYIPENQRGVVQTLEDPRLKTQSAPANATMLRIHGTFEKDGHDMPVTYTFALGADMVKNYQLFPNGHYKYKITINGRGDKATDSRVTYVESSGVDYTDLSKWPLSNCYICNPSSSPDFMAEYKIPVARVDEFWKGPYVDNQNNALSPDGQASAPWVVSVIWSDMEVKDSNIILSDLTGVGANGYFTVKIPSTCEMGNVIVGLKKADQDGNPIGNWLWSWHLWVTDYCPDEARYLYIQDAYKPGTDTYAVSGGKVQRYSVANPLSNQKVYMDRSIGALASGYLGYSRGLFYYQFGRKDPFPIHSASITYWEEGTIPKTSMWSKSYDGVANKTIARGSVPGTGGKNVEWTIAYPQAFIAQNGSWTTGDIYNPNPYIGGIIWQDPYANNHNGKSIFDPSPSGWKVPTGFISYNANATATNRKRPFTTTTGGVLGTTNVFDAPDYTLFFPMNGYREYNANLTNVGVSTSTHYVSSTVTEGNAYCFNCSTSSASNSNGARSQARPIIPVLQ